jgi:hypothetical protein
VTDPKTRGPKFWRNFGWLFVGVSLLNLVCGIVLVILGTPTGSVNIALGLIFAPQAVVYFRYWRKTKRELEDGRQP